MCLTMTLFYQVSRSELDVSTTIRGKDQAAKIDASPFGHGTKVIVFWSGSVHHGHEGDSYNLDRLRVKLHFKRAIVS